ncbi:sensor histidine kinase [Frankia nepalensis]|uniref:histidine kinase n=1 Tax=Frankia nepalensis TaxID=1836974 RepID=A0A937ULQ9_9ACTN|nr:histidine kinase [Frankia nepalensis]MBL7498919.1 hypothetical protein [Frankia nepalensis]MBL7513089.1 hypothetical protein [Frankia nepalensis]MBL7628109.1 hypothetical protein [Frankia nepalensis]
MRTQERFTAGTAAVVGMAIVVVGLAELDRTFRPPGSLVLDFIFLLLVAAAVVTALRAPAAALGTAWAAGLVQLIGGIPVLLTEGSMVVVLFAAARWGRVPTVLAAAASAGLAPVLGVAWVRARRIRAGQAGNALYDLLTDYGPPITVWGVILFGVTLLALPLLAGLTLRFLSRARTAQAARQVAEHDAQQAQEIARLRDAQNRLARDVHDVVGHSLTVILAQAESAQFLDDPDRLKTTMQTIATSARASLHDVRQVLEPAREPDRGRRGGLDALIETVRSSGQPVDSTEVGEARPLPPELDAVAYRVLQEMLTNAMKHGRRDRPTLVERRWPEPDSGDATFTIQVTNTVDAASTRDDLGGGQGVAGMRRRLASVGGSLDIRRTEQPDGPEGPDGPAFTAVAHLPVRSPSPGRPA